MQRLVLSLTIAALWTAGCRPRSDSKSRSIVGLEAGQDGRIRRAPAPIFLGLSDWFQKFKATTRGGPSAVLTPDMVDLKNRLPKAHIDALNAYIDQQMARISDLRSALDQKNTGEIRRLLDLESREMMDIALVIIHPSYQPVTGDLLARYMAASRPYGNLVDRFAAQGYLDVLLQYWSVPDLVKDAERQRQVYRDQLINLYLSLDGDFALEDTLRKSETSLGQMRAALQGERGPSGFNLAGESSEPTSVGPLGIFMSFLFGVQKTQMTAPASPLPAPAPTPTAKQNVAVSEAPKNVGLLGIAYNNPPGRSFLPPSPANSGQGKASLLDDGEGPVLQPRAAAEQAGEPLLPRIDAPLLDCAQFGLKGEALILCHRMAGFSNLKVDAKSLHLRDEPGAAESAIHLADAGASNLGLLRHKILAGAAENTSRRGHIFSQGAVGSCSLQSAMGAAYIELASLGVDPQSLLPKDGPEINSKFISVQRESTSFGAALPTIATLLPQEYTVQQAALNNFNDIKRCIDSGHPAYVGFYLDLDSWTNNRASGGQEFFLNDDTDSLSLTAGPALTCNGSGQNGHGVTVIGYTEGDLIIKNSWSSTWGDGGIAKVSGSSCMGAGFAAGSCVTIKRK